MTLKMKFMAVIRMEGAMATTVNSPIEAPPPIKAPPSFLAPGPLAFWTFLAISQPKIVRFSICKKPLEVENVLSLMVAPLKVFPKRPAPLLGNLRYVPNVRFQMSHWKRLNGDYVPKLS